MALDPITAVLDIGGKLIDKLWPDPQKAGEAKVQLFEMAQRGELAVLASETEIAKGQIEINKVEAGNNSLFVSGWRPAVGWVCVAGLIYTFIAWPLLKWYALIHALEVPPALDLSALITLLGGLLGLGGFRTFEKIKGVART